MLRRWRACRAPDLPQEMGRLRAARLLRLLMRPQGLTLANPLKLPPPRRRVQRRQPRALRLLLPGPTSPTRRPRFRARWNGSRRRPLMRRGMIIRSRPCGIRRSATWGCPRRSLRPKSPAPTPAPSQARGCNTTRTLKHGSVIRITRAIRTPPAWERSLVQRLSFPHGRGGANGQGRGHR